MKKLAGIAAATVAAAALAIGSAGVASAGTIVNGYQGAYVVGQDIQPGTYTSSGAVTGVTPCTWVRLGVSSGGQLIPIDYGEVRSGPVTVTIERGDSGFITSYCGDWERVGGTGAGSLGFGSLGNLFNFGS